MRQLPRLRTTTFIECAGVCELVITSLRAGGVGRGGGGGSIFRTIRFQGKFDFQDAVVLCSALLAGLPCRSASLLSRIARILELSRSCLDKYTKFKMGLRWHFYFLTRKICQNFSVIHLAKDTTCKATCPPKNAILNCCLP